MKKTLNLNIGGFAFFVEEDAASALETYLNSVRIRYASDPSADEICSDIEERIGELLLEKCGPSRIVTNQIVDYAKSVMGEFGSIDTEPDGGDVKAPSARKKRIFRDTDNKFLGGVFSGLAAYFDLDVVIFRIIYTVLCLSMMFADKDWSEALFGVLLLSYVVAWCCIPAARTVEQKCKMNGKPINVGDFARTSSSPVRESCQSPALHLIGRAVLILIGITMVVLGTGAIAAFGAMDFLPWIWWDIFEMPGVADTILAGNLALALFVPVLLLAAWNIYSGILLIFDLNSPKWRPGLILIVLFVLSLPVCGFFLVRAAGGLMAF